MGILGNLFGQQEAEEGGGPSDFGMRLAMMGQLLSGLSQGQTPNLAPGIAALQERRRELAAETKNRKWFQNQAALMADKNPRMAQVLQEAPPEVAQSLIRQYWESTLSPPDMKTFEVGGNVYRADPNDPNAKPELWISGTPKTPDWKTFEAGGDIYRYNPADPASKPDLFFDGPAPQPDGELGQYENDQKMRGGQGLPRQSFADWKQTTLAPKGPSDWERKYSAMVADMEARGVPEDQIPTLSEFLDDGLKITTSPDGTVSVTQGGAASSARPTEGDLRSKQIAASIAPDIPEAIEGFDQMSSFAGPLDGLGANFLNDENSQAAMDAIKNVATQAVYAISGAGTTENEMRNKIASMVPAPGDKPKTLRNKKRRLIATIKSMTSRAGVTPEELGFDPSLFDAAPTEEKAPAAKGPQKEMIWTPDGGLQEAQ
jgi:hypothetical protein